MKKYFILLAIAPFLIGCGDSGGNSAADKEAKERALVTESTDQYTVSYPEGYTKNTEYASLFTRYENTVLDTKIDVEPNNNFPEDTKLDQKACEALEDVVKFSSTDTVSSDTTFTDGDIQGCYMQTTSPSTYDDHYDYKLYYKTGDTVVYTVRINYPKDTPQVEIDNLKKAQDAFVIK